MGIYRHEVIFLDEKPLIDYMCKHGRGWESKDYELAVAIWLKRALDNSKGRSHCIAFELKEALSKCMPNFSSQNSDDIKQVLQKYKIESTYDAFIVEGTAAKHQKKGWAFQFKRLMGKDVVNRDFLEGLLDYIRRMSKEYAATESALVVIPEPNEEILLQPNESKRLSTKIAKDFKSNSFPFKRLLIMGKTEDNNVRFTEIWPAYFAFDTASSF